MTNISKEPARIEAIVAAMKEHGPLSVPRLVELTGWSRQTIATQLDKSADLFEKVSEAYFAPGGSIPATYYLLGAESNVSEDEFERRADEMCRSYAGWPEADQLLISAMRAMVTTGEQAWQQ